MQTYQDKKTPEMVAALRQLWADLAQVQEIEPTFGYQADIEFEVPEPEPGEMSSTFTDNEGKLWHYAPDQHYFQAQGVEVEEAEEIRPDPKLRAIVTWCLLLLFLGEVWALLFWVGAV